MTQTEFNTMMENYLAAMDAKAPSVWSADARAWAETEGIIKGDENGSKRYGALVTREEIAQMLFNQSK